ncbi:MAG: phosphatase [Oscillospiraceae bacterium]|nr:phosphatase [Oscillospiraceae bacterium]
MYTVKVDPHTHTLFSGHAYSTIGENLAQAAKQGLTGLGTADHAGPEFYTVRDGLPQWGYLLNTSALPREVDGVRLLSSAEIDIVDLEGHTACWDLRPPAEPDAMPIGERLLRTRDYAIASFHFFDGCRDGSFSQYTEMYQNVLRNPLIQILGHPCRPGFDFDMDEIVRTARAEHKLLEINEHSFDSPARITDRCRQLAIKCAEEGTSIVVSSDAHSAWFVGKFDRALAMLEEIHFPAELIANRSLEDFMAAVGKPMN